MIWKVNLLLFIQWKQNSVYIFVSLFWFKILINDHPAPHPALATHFFNKSLVFTSSSKLTLNKINFLIITLHRERERVRFKVRVSVRERKTELFKYNSNSSLEFSVYTVQLHRWSNYGVNVRLFSFYIYMCV